MQILSKVQYCKWLSEKTGKPYHLPTEAEWEKAARWKLSPASGTGQAEGEALIYPWGNDFDPQKANTKETKLGDTSDVSRFSPQGDSPYGCADMAGNVWEWCNDWFDENEYKRSNPADKRSSPADENRKGDVKDPQGNQTGKYRVLRGGSWSSIDVFVRSADRTGNDPTGTSLYIGFRCARSLL